MRETAHGGFKPAGHNLGVRIKRTDSAAVDGRRAVGTAARAAAGCIGVVRTAPFGGRVMRDHGIDVAARHPPAVFWRAETHIVAVRDRLRDHGDPIAERFQQARYDGNPKAGVIDICVAGYADEIGPLPTARLHFLRRQG